MDIMKADFKKILTVSNHHQLFDYFIYPYIMHILKMDWNNDKEKIKIWKYLNEHITELREDILKYSWPRLTLKVLNKLDIDIADEFTCSYYLVNTEDLEESIFDKSHYFGKDQIPGYNSNEDYDILVIEQNKIKGISEMFWKSIEHLIATSLLPIYSNSTSIIKERYLINLFAITYSSNDKYILICNNSLTYPLLDDISQNDDISQELGFYTNEDIYRIIKIYYSYNNDKGVYFNVNLF